MKIIWLGFAVLLIAGMAQATENFEIISYFSDKGIVRINQGTGQTNRPFSSFTSEEQKQITDWLADTDFLSSTRLSIAAEKQKERDDIYSTEVTPSRAKSGANGKTIEKTTGAAQNVSYTIELESSSAAKFRNISIAYRVFYEEKEGAISTKKCAYGTTTCAELLPGDTWTFATPAIDIRTGTKEIINVEWQGSNIMDSQSRTRSVSVQDKLKGAYFLVTKVDRNGELIQRECWVGLVPEKENWPDYQQDSPMEKSLKVKTNGAVVGKTFSAEQIQQYTKRAEDGNYMSALVLCEYYYGQGDPEKTKRWADLVKKLVKSRPKGQQEEAENRLASIGQIKGKSEAR
jgi:hypothetical protein